MEKKRPRRIVVSAPGGLLGQTRELMEEIRSTYGIQCQLIGDTCYGICDTVDEDVRKLEADLAINIGHNATVKRAGKHTYFIEAVDDVKFDIVTEKAITLLSPFKRLGLATFSQHVHELEYVRNKLQEAGFQVQTGEGNNLLLESQIFGCDFSTVYHLRNAVDAFCFLGESEFHAVGLALATNKPVYMLDPYLNEVRDLEREKEERRKRAILAIYKALDAQVFGVITGLKEGQKMLGRTRWITKRLEMHGRKVLQLAMRDITSERLMPYRDVEAFVQTACPRISIDGFAFDRPVLSIPQAEALVRLLEGKDLGEFLERPKWIELTVGLERKSH
jgi:2-(3-amino-3-carboxypropyl)histidine synthase